MLLTVNMDAAANQLLNEGEILAKALRLKDARALAEIKGWSLQKKALAKLVWHAKRDFPVIMFKALVEGWSAFKIRYEINKRLGKSGKGE